MARPTTPPSMETLSQPLPAAGERSVVLRLGRLALAIEGLDEPRLRRLVERFDPFAAAAEAEAGMLRVRLGLDDCDYYIDPPDGVENTRVHLACDGNSVRYLSYRVTGWFDLSTLTGQLRLARGEWEPELRAFENYIRAAVAWLAAALGGCLIHAASAVWREGGYLFYGESGAGKSTLSAVNRRGRVVSDDLSLVLPGGEGRLVLVGTPFRGTYEEGAPVEGDFPLRAGFRLIQSGTAAVRPVPRLQALGELVGNLPFLAEAFARRPDLFKQIERSFEPVPLMHLHFRKDDTFWDAIAEAEL